MVLYKLSFLGGICVFALLHKTKRLSNKSNEKMNKKEDVLDSLTDIGLSRNNNEDSVITITHPENDNLKLLAVADGVGGRESGEVASNFAIQTLEKWFKNLSQEKINNTSHLSKYLSQVIKFINNYLYIVKSNRTGCATTLTCAIINETDTVVANIGDSRAYTVKGKEIEQVTKDDSLVWIYYEQGTLKKEQLRFHKKSTLITKCIGPDYNTKPDITVLENESYDGILLFTDGVTDCLSDSKIKQLVHTKKEHLAKTIIQEAVYGKPSKRIPKGEEFYCPQNGKDNATVALYFKSGQYI